MEERDDYIPEQKGNEKRITPFERFVIFINEGWKGVNLG